MYSFFDYQPKMAYGGSSAGQDQQQQIMQVIQAYAQATGTAPEKVMEELQKLPPNKQQAALQNMVKSLQSAGNQSSMQTQPMAAEGMEVDGPGDGIMNFATGAGTWLMDKATKAASNLKKSYDDMRIIPANVKALGRMVGANLGMDTGPFVRKEDFTPEQLKSMKNAATNSQKRTGKTKGGVKYSDYGKGYGTVWDKNKMSLLTDPTRVDQTTIGRFNYANNPGGGVNVSDIYDFSNDVIQGSNPIKNLGRRAIQFLDDNIPADDPRRNVNFNIKKEGGLYKAQDGISIVDYLASKGQSFSKEARAKLAAEKGIKNYDYSAEKNLELLKALRGDGPTPARPVRKQTSTGKAPVVTPASGMFGSYNPTSNVIPYSGDRQQAVVKASKTPTVTPNMTEGQRTAALVKAGDMYTPSWKKTSPTLPSKASAKKEAATKSNIYNTAYGPDYVDLQQAFGLDPFSKEGIAKAQELTKGNPKTRIVCTAAGCSEIAVNAAEAFGYDFDRGNAWDLGNKNKVIAQNPAYASMIGKGILPDPTVYTSPASVFNHPGSIIGLNRRNNRVAGDRNDSYEYADQSLYPGSRGYEHVGYMLDDKSMLHGTGKSADHPSYYVIDPDVSNGVQLRGYGSYQPVEAISPDESLWSSAKSLFGFEDGGYYTNKAGKKVKAKGTGTNQGNVYFKNGGMPCYECGGMYAYGGDIIPNYMKETSPMYNFGGYFPQGPRFAEGGKMPQWLAEARFKASGSQNKMPQYGYADGGQTMDNTMMGMINVFESGGIVVGNTYDATPEFLQKLSAGGYTYEFV